MVWPNIVNAPKGGPNRSRAKKKKKCATSNFTKKLKLKCGLQCFADTAVDVSCPEKVQVLLEPSIFFLNNCFNHSRKIPRIFEKRVKFQNYTGKIQERDLWHFLFSFFLNDYLFLFFF